MQNFEQKKNIKNNDKTNKKHIITKWYFFPYPLSPKVFFWTLKDFKGKSGLNVKGWLYHGQIYQLCLSSNNGKVKQVWLILIWICDEQGLPIQIVGLGGFNILGITSIVHKLSTWTGRRSRWEREKRTSGPIIASICKTSAVAILRPEWKNQQIMDLCYGTSLREK